MKQRETKERKKKAKGLVAVGYWFFLSLREIMSLPTFFREKKKFMRKGERKKSYGKRLKWKKAAFLSSVLKIIVLINFLAKKRKKVTIKFSDFFLQQGSCT